MKLCYVFLTLILIISLLWIFYKRKKRIYDMRKKVLGLNRKNKKRFKRQTRYYI